MYDNFYENNYNGIYTHNNRINTFPVEQLSIENIIKFNNGKKVDVYLTIPNSSENKSQIFSGIIEHSGKDSISISNPQTGEWYLLPTKYIDYIKFNEKINYGIEFNSNR